MFMHIGLILSIATKTYCQQLEKCFNVKILFTIVNRIFTLKHILFKHILVIELATLEIGKAKAHIFCNNFFSSDY